MTKFVQNNVRNTLGLAIASIIAGSALSAQALASENIADALSSGTAYGDFRLRYEYVDQDNTKDNAKALTLRSRGCLEKSGLSFFLVSMTSTLRCFSYKNVNTSERK